MEEFINQWHQTSTFTKIISLLALAWIPYYIKNYKKY
jgi:hypothetical protein